MEPIIMSTSRIQHTFHIQFFKLFNEPRNNGDEWKPKDIWGKMHSRGFTSWSTDKFSKFAKPETGTSMNLSIDEISALAQIIGIPLTELVLGDRSAYDLLRQSDAAWVRFKDSLERVNFALLDCLGACETYLRLLIQLRRLGEEIYAKDDFAEWWKEFELLTEQKPTGRKSADGKEELESLLYLFTNSHAAIGTEKVTELHKKRILQNQQINLILDEERWSY
ncbi:hypothetical protein ACVXZ4_04260 [Lacisediminihabitans sp. FW035]